MNFKFKDLLQKYFKKIFEKKWLNLVKIILDDYDLRNKNDFKIFRNPRNDSDSILNAKNDLREISTCCCCNDNDDYKFSSDNILMQIRKSQDSSLLKHVTTKRLIANEWKYFPGLHYYFNLFIYLFAICCILFKNYSKLSR